jgi:hypothetical protein
MKAKRCGRFINWNSMSWPLHIENDDDSVEWRLRYGQPTKQDLLVAASIMSAYRTLVTCTQKKRMEVVAVLRSFV